MKYQNATVYKLNNKRITVQKIENGFGITLQILDKNDITVPHLFTNIQKGIRTTNFGLSKEAASALYFALQSQLTLDDVIDFIKVPDLEVSS